MPRQTPGPGLAVAEVEARRKRSGSQFRNARLPNNPERIVPILARARRIDLFDEACAYPVAYRGALRSHVTATTGRCPVPGKKIVSSVRTDTYNVRVSWEGTVTDLHYAPDHFAGAVDQRVVRFLAKYRHPLDPAYLRHAEQFHGGIPGKSFFDAADGKTYRVGRFLTLVDEKTKLQPPVRPSWEFPKRDIRIDRS